jgi:hypothetical protein
MRAFVTASRDEAIVQAILAHITWYHHLAILKQLTLPEERIWCARATDQHGWRSNVLLRQIEAGHTQRQGKAVANFERTLPALNPICERLCGLRVCG